MNTEQRYFFRKENKLKSRKIIQQVFAEGKSFAVFPIKAVWIPENQQHHLQTGISVSSRFFKKAVDRNNIKRVIREAYRLQKNSLEELLIEKNKRVSLFLIYTGKVLPEYKDIFDSCTAIINRLIKLNDAKN